KHSPRQELGPPRDRHPFDVEAKGGRTTRARRIIKGTGLHAALQLHALGLDAFPHRRVVRGILFRHGIHERVSLLAINDRHRLAGYVGDVLHMPAIGDLALTLLAARLPDRFYLVTPALHVRLRQVSAMRVNGQASVDAYALVRYETPGPALF